MTFMRIIHTELFMNNSVIDEFKFPRGKKVLSENMRRPKNIYLYIYNIIQYYIVIKQPIYTTLQNVNITQKFPSLITNYYIILRKKNKKCTSRSRMQIAGIRVFNTMFCRTHY